MGLSVKNLSDIELVKKVAQSIRNLAVRLDVPQHISEVGAKEEDISLLAQKALNDPCTPGNPRDVSLSDLEDLFRSAL